MYEMTSKPLVRRTLATLRSAEFGFFGVVVYTRVHTPRRCGAWFKAADLLLFTPLMRPFLTNCCIVGISNLLIYCCLIHNYIIPHFKGGQRYIFLIDNNKCF